MPVWPTPVFELPLEPLSCSGFWSFCQSFWSVTTVSFANGTEPVPEHWGLPVSEPVGAAGACDAGRNLAGSYQAVGRSRGRPCLARLSSPRAAQSPRNLAGRRSRKAAIPSA